MAKFKVNKLEDLLLEAGIISSGELQLIKIAQKKSGQSFMRSLIESNIITEEKLLETLETHLGIPYVDLFNYQLNPQVVTLIPQTMARSYGVVLIDRQEGKLILAMADPLNLMALEDVSVVTKEIIEPVIASESAITYTINQYYGLQESMGQASLEHEITYAAEEESPYTVEELVVDAPIVKVVNSIIQKAVAEKASDIHIEPTENGAKVRMRVDGMLYHLISPPLETRQLIVSRIKIMSDMNIAEKRIPQDGQIKMQVDGRTVNMRVSTMPTVHGERVVLRLLEKDRVILPLDSIGFTPSNNAVFRNLIGSSYGLILLTGPTGCGKTTTLYSTLNHISSDKSNIITIEDPVEYRLDNINQVQVNPKIGLTFAACLRAILRQDPDVIMLGEMRDGETADMGTRAGLTGHLVFSTLHTNNASQAVIRLLEMGVPHFLVSASLVGVVAQRLVRKICEYCREEYVSGEKEKLIYRAAGIQKPPLKLFRGKGCRRCHGGYHGRTAIHELQLITPEMREMITAGTTAACLREKAFQMGYNNLLQDGLGRVEEGVTTLEEVVRVAFDNI